VKVRSTLAGLGIIAAFLVCPAEAYSQSEPPSRKIGPESRLFMRFIEDAAIVPSYWLEGRAQLMTNLPAFDDGSGSGNEASRLDVGPVFALNVAEDFEFGARVSLSDRDPEGAASKSGLSDMDIWGKVSVVTDPVKISLGVLLSLPTGNSDKLLGTGETDVEFFGGIRKDFAHLTLVGNAGFRVNQDPDFGDLTLEGKNSVLVGGALLFPAGDRVVLSAEWAFETERYRGLDSDSRLLGGFEYRQNESVRFRAAAGGGISQGAPGFMASGSVVWLF